jgi:hypothetical protein
MPDNSLVKKRHNMQTLKFTNPMMHGLAVKRFQQFGEAVFDKDLVENDGWYGLETRRLALLVQKHLGLTEDGVVGPKTWSAIFAALNLDSSGAQRYCVDDIQVIDGRNIWTPVKKWYGGMRFSHSNTEVSSTIATYTDPGRNRLRGIMLHQTGCWMPEDPSVWARINAHCGVTREGDIILMFPFEMLIWHGNGLTRPTIGVEIAGLFPGIKGKKNTYWPPMAETHEFTDKQKKATDILMSIIQDEFEKNGGTWEVIYAHRQSSNMRMADPGDEIWKKIAIPWMDKLNLHCGGIAVLGSVTDGAKYCVGNGMPIPQEWDDNNPYRFWG